MPQFILYSDASRGEGASFTAESLELDAARFRSPMELVELVELGAEQVEGGVVTRSSIDASGRYYRLAGFREVTGDLDRRAASEWWDVRAELDGDGVVSLISRDTLTGSLLVDNSSLSPMGMVSGITRFQGYTTDGSALAPIFSAQGGQWDASMLLASDGAARHALLTRGSDVVTGSELNDRIQSGGGVDELIGLGGADQFLVERGASSRWVRGRKAGAGVLVGTATRKRGGSNAKRFSAFDADVDVILDYEKGFDSLLLQGPVSRYSFEDNGESTLIFSGSSRRNLAAVVVGVRGLGRADVLSWV